MIRRTFASASTGPLRALPNEACEMRRCERCAVYYQSGTRLLAAVGCCMNGRRDHASALSSISALKAPAEGARQPGWGSSLRLQAIIHADCWSDRGRETPPAEGRRRHHPSPQYPSAPAQCALQPPAPAVCRPRNVHRRRSDTLRSLGRA